MRDPTTIRVLTFNIRLGIERGLDAIADTLREAAPDLVALQEVGSYWNMGPKGPTAAILSRAANLPHAIFAAALTRGGGTYGIALLSGVPFLRAGRALLPCLEDEQRILLRAERADGLRIWTTHLSIVGADRNAQLDLLAQLARTAPPDILLGDLNTCSDDPRLPALSLENAWGDAPEPTYPTKNPRETIDHILLAPRCTIIDPARAVAANSSDHLPVQAIVGFGQEPP